MLALLARPAHPASPYVIDAIISLSGGAALYGKQAYESITAYYEGYLKAENIAGHPVLLNIYDEQTNANLALSLIRRAVFQDNAIAIVGLSSNATYKPAIPVVGQYGIPTMATVGRYFYGEPRSGNPYMFTVAVDHLSYIDRVGEFFRATGRKDIGVINSDDGFGEATSEYIRITWPRVGINPTLYTIPYQANDLTQQMTRLRDRNHDAVFVQAAGFGGVTAIRNLRQVGFRGLVIAQPTYTLQAAKEGLGRWAEGVVAVTLGFPGEPLPRQRAMMDAVRAMYPASTIGFLHYGAWDAMAILHRALKASTPDPANIRDAREKLYRAIEQVRGYEGAAGVFNLAPDDHVGIGPKDFLFGRYDREGNLVRIDLAELK